MAGVAPALLGSQVPPEQVLAPHWVLHALLQQIEPTQLPLVHSGPLPQV